MAGGDWRHILGKGGGGHKFSKVLVLGLEGQIQNDFWKDFFNQFIHSSTVSLVKLGKLQSGDSLQCTVGSSSHLSIELPSWYSQAMAGLSSPPCTSNRVLVVFVPFLNSYLSHQKVIISKWLFSAPQCTSPTMAKKHKTRSGAPEEYCYGYMLPHLRFPSPLPY